MGSAACADPILDKGNGTIGFFLEERNAFDAKGDTMKTEYLSRRVRLSLRLTLGMLLFATLSFIFLNSLTPAPISLENSGSVYSLLSRLLGFLPFFTHAFLRKAAHFTEYAVLGYLCFFIPSVFMKKRKREYAMVLLLCAAVALLDEGVQTLVAGRYGSLWDSLLDFSGALFGFLLPLLYRSIKYGKRMKL